MKRGDVFAVSWQGGGGFGDPLERDPERGAGGPAARPRCREQAASEVYGVVITRDGVDARSDPARRRAMRRARVGTLCDDPDALRAGRADRFARRPTVHRARQARRCMSSRRAGFMLATGSTRWRAGAVAVPMEPPAALPIHLHEHLAMTAYCCPATGALLSVDVHEKGSTPADDIVLDLDALVEGTAKLQVRPAPLP